MMKKVSFAAWLLVCMMVGFVGCGADKTAPTAAPIDPNSIASVVTGNTTLYVLSLEELQAALDPSGNSVVTLLKDVSTEDTIRLPYTCTLDMNGHTVETNRERGIGISVEEAGQENPTFTLKNGILRTYSDSIRSKKGALVISNVKMYTSYGSCVVLYDENADYKSINRIENSVLVSGYFGCLNYNGSDVDYSATGITIENTQLVACNQEGAEVFRCAGGNTLTGLVELGAGVEIYSYAQTGLAKNVLFNGSGMARNLGVDVTIDNVQYQGINQWKEDTENQVIDVLMIGNSFCWYFTDELHAVAEAANVQINVNNIYDAGCYVNEHWQWLQEDAEKYQQYWITNDFGHIKHPENLKLSTALAYEDWDVITLQQHFGSGVKNVDAALEKCTPYADDLFTYLKENHPEATLYWHTTWAYQVGHESMPSTADQTLRQNNIIKVSQTIIDRNDVLEIPCGQAWAIARANPLVGDKLCRTDLYHDGDVGGGQYLNACVWFEVLSGKSCIGNTWRPATYRLSEEKIAQLQLAAHEAVAAVYGEDYTG